MNEKMRMVPTALRPAGIKALFAGRHAAVRRRGFCFVATFAVAWFSAMPLMAGNSFWNLEGTTGKWENAANWNGGVPNAGAGAFLGWSSPATNMFAEITEEGMASANLYLGAWNTNASGTLIISSGSLTVGAEIFICDGGAFGAIHQTGGALTGLSGSSVHISRTGYPSRGEYTISGGTMITPSLVIGSYGTSGGCTGTFYQSGGTVHVANNLILGGWYYAEYGLYRLTGGSLILSNGCAMTLGSLGAYGEFYLGDTNGTGSIVGGAGASLTVYNGPKFQGWGTVAITGTLTNYRKIIADGYGTDRSLDLSSFTNVVCTDNTTTYGWYVQNRGKLILPNIPVTADAAYYWGDNNGPDYVNSAKLTFSSVTTTGAVAGALLSVGRADTDAQVNSAEMIGLWEFTATNGLAFGSMTPVFRYDDAAVTSQNLAPTELKIWHKTGATWEMLRSTVNTSTKTISAQQPVATLGQFAVALDMQSPYLIGAWRLDGDFKDASGHGYDGVGTNGAATVSPGKIGSGMLNSTWVHSGRRFEVANTPGTESFTASFWGLWPGSWEPAYDYPGPIGKVSLPASDTNGWYINPRSGGGMYVIIGAAGAGDLLEFGSFWVTNAWQHLVVSYDGVTKTARAYRNGNFLSAVVNAGAHCASNNAAQLQIGQVSADGINNNYAWYGNMDDVALWNEPLSDTRVKAVYSLGNSALNYGAADAQALFNIYAGGPGSSGTVRGSRWVYATGLSGTPGTLVNGTALILNSNGSGVRIPAGAIMSFR